jgi:phosphatidylserine/phosphatidylglycerophosphate/cardiolipin synthase-like enzyme
VLVPFVSALSGLLLAATAAAPSTPAEESPGHPVFNDPLGTHRQQYALISSVNRRIDHTPGGATIRLAAFSFAMPSTSRALLRAHRRGVVVKMVVDQRSARWGSVQRLRSVLGSDVSHRSFVRVCHASCRGTAGKQHAKFVTISRTDHARKVVLVGSMNFTELAAARQWQDLYAVSDDGPLFASMRTLFRSMVRDKPQPELELAHTGPGFRLSTSPVDPGAADPLVARLRKVHCDGAAAGTGRRGHTLLAISMHAWNGARGVDLARRVGALAEDGCRVRVIAGVGFGRRVTSILERSGASYLATGDTAGATHEKLMVLSGHFGRDRAASLVWTGSHNWTGRSLRNDEVTLRLQGPRHVAAYLANVRRIWRATTR